jgi:antitoxin ParD1/3/4
MNVNLGPQLDSFVADMLKTGLYQTQSEVLREGLRLLKDQETLRQMHLEELRKEIARGIAAADAGRFVDGPKTMAGLIKKARAAVKRGHR